MGKSSHPRNRHALIGARGLCKRPISTRIDATALLRRGPFETSVVKTPYRGVRLRVPSRQGEMDEGPRIPALSAPSKPLSIRAIKADHLDQNAPSIVPARGLRKGRPLGVPSIAWPRSVFKIAASPVRLRPSFQEVPKFPGPTRPSILRKIGMARVGRLEAIGVQIPPVREGPLP